ncbi:hypothetical protein N9N67_09660, partial [Bacteriovoracaceae bacterium]|nr:hypothetical protein [Bacteriovoracaceae bacterium]
MERNCIIMAPVTILVKEWRRAVSRNPNYQFYDVAKPGEFTQLIGVVDSSIIFVTDIKVCKEILVKNKKYTKSKMHRVVLINDKQ